MANGNASSLKVAIIMVNGNAHVVESPIKIANGNGIRSLCH